MGKLLIIGVLTLASIFGGIITYMNRHTEELPDIITTDLTNKEATNISNYAIRYATQFTERKNFTVPEEGDSIIFQQRFADFPVLDGFIDSISYRYIPEVNHLRIRTFSRARINDVLEEVHAEAAIRLPPPYLNGSIAAWSMDEESWDGINYDVLDSSENNNDGIAEGGANTTEDDEFGIVGSFDGVDDYIEIPNDESLQLVDSFSLCVWGNIDPNADTSIMLWKDSGISSSVLMKYPSYGIWWRGQEAGLTNQLVAGIVTMESTDELESEYDPEHYYEVQGDFIPDGDWHLFSLVFDQGRICLYLDAVLIDSRIIDEDLLVYISDYSATLGAASIHHSASGHPFLDRYYDGLMDELGVWGEPLTQEQLMEIFKYKMLPPLIYVRE